MTPKKGAGASQPAKKTVPGIIQITRKAVGYVPWPPSAEATKGTKEREDIEVAKDHLGGALDGDQVEIAISGLFPRPTGKVVAVVERAKTEFVATLTKNNGAWVGTPASQKFYRPIRLSGDVQAEEGSKVLVKLISFTGKEDPLGEVIEVIGTAGEHRVEMNAIVLEHGFRVAFSADVASEAKQIEHDHEATIASEAPKRADYRDVTTFTIDPADAKDFDDALSIKELNNGEYEIGVHIADATYFVRPDTPLGREAEKRGTSVYLVDATIPMLPHELSGNVCSLKEGEDRLTFSAVFRMNKSAEVLERRFEKSIIRSNKRFVYEEAQAVLDQDKGPYIKELTLLRDLARLLKKKRETVGAIDFGTSEVRFELDENGTPIGVVRKVPIETNSLIEEFMLLANKAVAEHISHLAARVPEKNLVFLYRIHDMPKEDRIEELATFVRAVGFEFGNRDKKKKYTARDIAKLLKDIEGTPEESLIRTATLRSMAKAVYSTKNIGHFGLAFEHYTHFTSPIRRYPDMLVHRVLASHLSGKPITRKEFTNLEQLCIAASEQEAKAADAERESIRYKQVEYMSKKIGQEFDGVVSGVTDWGLYIEEKETACEGLVRIRTIGNEYFNYDPKAYALIGEKTKKKYALGDSVRFKVVAGDLAARTLDFVLV